jgi:hypothetical protein
MAQLSDDIALYEQQTKKGTVDPFPYDRLMIYYRKRKEFKKELHLINQALQTFTDHLKKQAGTILGSAKSQATIKKLSEKINRSAGLVDKKGKPKYVPEPILRWTKRKKTVQEKLKRMSQ